MTEKDRIYKAREEQYEFGKSTCFEDFRKAIESHHPPIREGLIKLINRYKRLEEGEKDNIWGCALRCFIKDLNSLLPNKVNDD